MLYTGDEMMNISFFRGNSIFMSLDAYWCSYLENIPRSILDRTDKKMKSVEFPAYEFSKKIRVQLI